MDTVFDDGYINDGVAKMINISAIPKDKKTKQNSNKNQESSTRTIRQVVQESQAPNIFKQTILAMTKFFGSLLFRNYARKNQNMMNNVSKTKESSKSE